jgi:hypothetical protein
MSRLNVIWQDVGGVWYETGGVLKRDGVFVCEVPREGGGGWGQGASPRQLVQYGAISHST